MPGLLISVALAAGTVVLIPPPFASISTVVLIPAPKKGGNSLLNFDTGLSTSAEIVVQAMGGPQIADEMGLVKGKDTLEVVNGNADAKGKITETSGPFISVTAQSTSAARATALAQQATTRVQQELAKLQQSVKVKKQQSINLSSVVSATPGKRVMAMLLRTAGLTMFLGFALTLGAVLLVDRRVRRRQSLTLRHPDGASVAPTALRSTSGATHRLDKFDPADLLVSGQPPHPAGENGRKTHASR